MFKRRLKTPPNDYIQCESRNFWSTGFVSILYSKTYAFSDTWTDNNIGMLLPSLCESALKHSGLSLTSGHGQAPLVHRWHTNARHNLLAWSQNLPSDHLKPTLPYTSKTSGATINPTKTSAKELENDVNLLGFGCRRRRYWRDWPLQSTDRANWNFLCIDGVCSLRKVMQVATTQPYAGLTQCNKRSRGIKVGEWRGQQLSL